jgi:GntR family transcriptional regulator
MASQLRINPLTVTRAYRELESEGIVVTEHGRGTYISTAGYSLGDDYRQNALDQIIDTMLVEARRLGATPDEIMQSTERRLQLLLGGRADEVSGTGTQKEMKIDG